MLKKPIKKKGCKKKNVVQVWKKYRMSTCLSVLSTRLKQYCSNEVVFPNWGMKSTPPYLKPSSKRADGQLWSSHPKWEVFIVTSHSYCTFKSTEELTANMYKYQISPVWVPLFLVPESRITCQVSPNFRPENSPKKWVLDVGPELQRLAPLQTLSDTFEGLWKKNIPSSNWTGCYWKGPFIVDWPIQDGGFPVRFPCDFQPASLNQAAQ